MKIRMKSQRNAPFKTPDISRLKNPVRALVFLLCLTSVAMSLFAFFPSQEIPKTPLLGFWQGTMQTKIGPLEVYFVIERKDQNAYLAKITIPAQKVREMPIQEVRYVPPDLVLDMSSFGIRFEGKMAAEGDRIAGTFMIGPDRMDLVLRRSAGIPDMGRPQEPKKPYPYEEIEVRFQNGEAGVFLSGTLTIPRGAGPFPAAVLLSGSGPQDRDSVIAGHRPFLVWADALTRMGIAVLRCDDRGVGKSGGDFHLATTADFATDALAAWTFLANYPGIDRRNVGFIGHSEGGLIGPMAAVRNPDVAFLVLLAGTGIPGDRLALMQTEAVSKSRGAGAEAIRKESKMYEGIFRIIQACPTAQEAEGELKKIVGEAVAGMSDSEKKELNVTKESLLADLEGILADYGWNRFFLGYDPAIALGQVRCRVLALVGDKDTQVPADANLAAIEQALKTGGKSRYDIKKLPGLNHMFQTAQTGHPREYAKIDETIAPAVLKLVGDWILSEPGRPKGLDGHS